VIRLWPSLKVGEPAPGFSLPDGAGKLRSLEEFAGRWLVIFFYPADFTSGCTVESCAFRDEYGEFKDMGAEVLGVSGDSSSSHLAFAAKHGLQFPLLSDSKAEMRRAYTVPHIFGRMSGRTTFVVDAKGVLRYVFNSRSRFHAHVRRCLEFLRGN